MQDRFLFRMWNEQTEKMIHFGHGRINYHGEERDQGLFFPFSPTVPGSMYMFDWKMMQCTGLKDKNKKLIFEGDIVQIAKSGDDGFPVYETWNDAESGRYVADDELYVVKYNECDACFLLFDSSGEPCKYIRSSQGYVKILGNIHENPELVKVEGEENERV